MPVASKRAPPLLMREDALDTVERADAPPAFKSAARALVTEGIAIIRGAHDRALCARTIADYERYAAENRAYVQANLDSLGHEKRLVNFHLWSANAARIGTDPQIMALLDFLFGMEACVYTSLTFKYGTQQPVHRDTPHFATWPRGYFLGVWTALEDIDPDAGPIFYHRGGQHFAVNERAFWDEARQRSPDAPESEQLLLALNLYNGEVIRRATALGNSIIPELRAGDVVVWHPETPHGGSPARNPERTRWSIVFHCAPASVQVHQHQDFFRRAGGDEPPARYGFTRANDRQIAAAGGVGYM